MPLSNPRMVPGRFHQARPIPTPTGPVAPFHTSPSPNVTRPEIPGAGIQFAPSFGFSGGCAITTMTPVITATTNHTTNTLTTRATPFKSLIFESSPLRTSPLKGRSLPILPLHLRHPQLIIRIPHALAAL